MNSPALFLICVVSLQGSLENSLTELDATHLLDITIGPAL
jgi:hypothetical protein